MQPFNTNVNIDLPTKQFSPYKSPVVQETYRMQASVYVM